MELIFNKEIKMEEKELEEIIQKETIELAEKQFLNGVLVGWNTCLFNIKK